MKLNKRLGIISVLLIACATPLIAMETPTSNASQNTEQSETHKGYFDDMKKPAEPKSIFKLFMLSAMKAVAKTTRKVGPAYVNGDGEQVEKEFSQLDEMEQFGFGLGVAALIYGVYKYSNNLVNGVFALLKAFGIDYKAFKKGQENATDDLKQSKFSEFAKPFFKEEKRKHHKHKSTKQETSSETSSANNNVDTLPAGVDSEEVPTITNQ